MKKWHEIDGWFDHADYHTYYSLASFMPKRFKMLEIGAYKGRSTTAMIEVCENLEKSGVIDVIDTFRGGEHIGDVDTYTEFLDNTEFAAKNIYVMRGNSRDIHKLMAPNTKYDLIYIDGSHDYDSVYSDITDYWRFLKDGGVMAGHDYYHYDVQRAVTDHPKTANHAVHNNSWLVIK